MLNEELRSPAPVPATALQESHSRLPELPDFVCVGDPGHWVAGVSVAATFVAGGSLVSGRNQPSLRFICSKSAHTLIHGKLRTHVPATKRKTCTSKWPRTWSSASHQIHTETHACIYIHTYIHTYIHPSPCIHASMHPYILTYIHNTYMTTYINTCVRKQIHIHIYMYIYIYIYMHTSLSIYIHIYI